MGNGTNIFVVRLKNNRRIFGRHVEANSPEHAKKRVKGKGKILSIRKLHPEDIIGTIDSMNLKDIIGVRKEGLLDTYNEEYTLDSIVFGKSNRRFNFDREKRNSRTTENNRE